MDSSYDPTSLSEFLQNQQAIVYELAETYQRIISDLARFLQELPADLLLQADGIEGSPPVGMEYSEAIAFANGIRYAAISVASSITAKMAMEQAEFKGEFNAGEDLGSKD